MIQESGVCHATLLVLVKKDCFWKNFTVLKTNILMKQRLYTVNNQWTSAWCHNKCYNSQ